MIVYAGNPKDSKKKKNLLELINQFSKEEAGYKVNTKTSYIFTH